MGIEQIGSLISIIIPYYNKKGTIVRSVNSVLAQTYLLWELIIIDDCGEEKLDIDQIPQDNRISIHYNELNLGAAKTRQRGLDLSKGEYIAFLDADDWWDIDFLKNCLIAVENNFESDGVYVLSEIREKNEKVYYRRYSNLSLTKIRETIIERARPWQTGGILWRKTSCGNWGFLKTNEDAWFEISSSKFNKLISLNYIGYFVDRTSDVTLSNYYYSDTTSLNQQDLYLMIYRLYFHELSRKYKIILIHRLIRGHLKITENCSKSKIEEYREKLKKLNIILWLYSYSNLLLKLHHKTLQRSPFKIHY